MQKTIHSRQQDVFLKLLRRMRDEAGVTQIELAKRLKTTQSIVSKAERGERRLDAIELFHWCNALDADYSDFAKQLAKALAPRHRR